MPSPARRAWRPWLLAGAALLLPALYAGMFAGDAIIHLAYAERAAQGHFYEFNPGEPTSGVTSPGYLLLLTAAFLTLPAALVPVAAKAVGIASWVALVLVTYRLARRILPEPTAFVCALILALMPGSAYNATVGMENGLFALAVWSAVAVGSASAGAGDSRGRALAGPILWVVAVWLRPEGLLAAALWHAARLSDPALPRRKRGAIVTPGMTAVALAVAGAVAFQYAITGDLLASSARSRVWLASLDSRSLGPFSVDARFALRLAAYAPLLVAAIVGTGSAFQRRGDVRADWRFTVALLWGGFVLYTIVTGGAHLARYTIFLMPALCLLAGLGWESLARRAVLAPGRRRRLVAVAGLLALGVVFAYEARLRRSLGSPQMLRAAMAAPDRRVARTTDFLRMLETSGDRPVSVALVEVQLRYFLDGRVIVRSLDGRTDGRLLDFVSGTAVDYVGYLRDRGVDVVMEFPGRPGADGSLADLVDLPANGRVERGGLIFQRIGSAGAVRIVRPGA